MDWNDDVEESDEGDNRRRLNLTVRPSPIPEPVFPDLVVTSLIADRTTVQAGENVHLTAMIRNAGGGEARNISLAWRPAGNAQYLRITDGLTLQPNEERAVEWDYDFPNAGTYDTQALVDPENRVREGNEGNNSLGLRIRVQAPARRPCHPRRCRSHRT